MTGGDSRAYCDVHLEQGVQRAIPEKEQKCVFEYCYYIRVIVLGIREKSEIPCPLPPRLAVTVLTPLSHSLPDAARFPAPSPSFPPSARGHHLSLPSCLRS